MEPVFTSTKIPTIGQCERIIGLSSFRNAVVGSCLKGGGWFSVPDFQGTAKRFLGRLQLLQGLHFCLELGSTASFHERRHDGDSVGKRTRKTHVV